jgi:hypothetical protein
MLQPSLLFVTMMAHIRKVQKWFKMVISYRRIFNSGKEEPIISKYDRECRMNVYVQYVYMYVCMYVCMNE